jgi:hypothetical protein
MSKFSKIGEATFAKVEKVVRRHNVAGARDQSNNSRRQPQNAELFILTYGAIVSQALKDNASVADVNKYLDQM